MLIRDSLQLYREEFGKILLLGLIVIVPIQFLCILINNYFYFYYWLPQIHIADLFYGINMLIAGSLVQIPFIKLLDSYRKREYIEFSSAYGSFWQYGFVVFVMSILYTLGVVTGTFLLLIPGLVLMVLFNAFPFAVVLDEKMVGRLQTSLSIWQKQFLETVWYYFWLLDRGAGCRVDRPIDHILIHRPLPRGGIRGHAGQYVVCSACHFCHRLVIPRLERTTRLSNLKPNSKARFRKWILAFFSCWFALCLYKSILN